MSLIGISGYAGVGKNLVGTIIQYLSCPNPSRSLEDILKEPKHHNEWWLEETSGWETKSWAHKLKQICSIITGIPLEKFEDQEFKKTYLGPEWGVFHKTIKNERGYPINVENRLITVREMLQMVGTDCLRNQFNYNIWINALFADYTPTQVQWADGPLGGYEDGPLPNWIITDTRFLNEVEAIKKRDGKVIRVNRAGVKPPNGHSSEMELSNYTEFDYVLENNGTLEDLIYGVSKMLTELGFDQKPTIYNSLKH
jgi:hypothetical protein